MKRVPPAGNVPERPARRARRSTADVPPGPASPRTHGGDDDGPAIPFELLQYALPPFLAYHTQWTLGQTCRRLAATWKQSVHELPLRLLARASDAEMNEFSNINTLVLQTFHGGTPRFLDPDPDLTRAEIYALMWRMGWQFAGTSAGRHGSITSDNRLARLTSLTSSLTSLRIQAWPAIADRSVATFQSLTRLDLFCTNIGDGAISCLTRLRELSLVRTERITDAGVGGLTSLTALRLGSCTSVTDAGLSALTSLTSLDLAQNGVITNAGISRLVSLRTLDLADNYYITSDGIKRLTALHTLGLCGNRHIRGRTVDKLKGHSLKTVYTDEQTLLL